MGFVTAAAAVGKIVAVGFMVVHHGKHFSLLLMRKFASWVDMRKHLLDFTLLGGKLKVSHENIARYELQ